MAEKKTNESEEFKVWWNSLPPSRRVVAIAGTIGLFASIVGLIVTSRYDTRFEVFLALMFLLFLCGAHVKFAMAQALTQRRVRKIDYWYLGAATIGLFLAAIGYSPQRNETVFRINHKLYETVEQSRIDAVNGELSGLTKFLCLDLRITKQACAGVKHVAAEVRPGLSATQIRSISDELIQKVAVPYQMALPPEVSKNADRLLPIVVVALKLDEWREYAQLSPELNAKPPKLDEGTQMFLNFSQWVLWPFLFAFALALRITKVTIDVFEWAK